MEVNGKRKRSQLSEDESTARMYNLPNEAGLEYIEDSSSEDEGYVETAPNSIPSRENDMMMSAFDIGAHVAPINNGSSSNVGASTEIMTNVMALVSNNGNNYNHSRRKWTYDMDERLREGFNLYGKQWAKVADHVGYGLHREQCRKRWCMAANVELQNRRKGTEWTDEELLRLRILADSHENRRVTNNGLVRKDVVNWTMISKELNRDYKECADKYKALMTTGMIKGPYTREEDAFILARVREWGNKGQGLWVTLQSELNRRGDSINKRWQRLTRGPEAMMYGIDQQQQPQQQQQQQQQQHQQPHQQQHQQQQPHQQQHNNVVGGGGGGDINTMF